MNNHRRAGVGVAAATAITAFVVGIAPASGSTEGAGSSAGRCPSGAVDAVIAGKGVCLRRGKLCTKRLDRQYHRYGFHCHNGRLTGGPSAPQPLPSAGTVVATIPVAGMGGLVVGGGSVWVAGMNSRTVTRIDPRTQAVVATIPLGEPDIAFGFGPTFLAFGHSSLWVLDGASSRLVRIDPETMEVSASISLGSPTQLSSAPLGISLTSDAVWVASRWGTADAPNGAVTRIDPNTNEVVAKLPLGTDPEALGPTFVAAGPGAVWVGIPSIKSVARIDPATNTVVATIPGFTCAAGQLLVDGPYVWVADCDVVRRIDSRTNTIVQTIPIPGFTGSGVHGIAMGLDSVWVQAGPLVRIDPRLRKLTGSVPLEESWVECTYSIAFGFGSIWVRQLDDIVRIQPRP